MSDFNLTADQRRSLAAGRKKPLEFPVKPYGCQPQARYVIQYTRSRVLLLEDGHVVRIPAEPVWWITITHLVRHRKGHWVARYDITDLRDPTLFLKAGGTGYTTSRHSAVDELAVVVTDEVREAARAEQWHLRRLAAHAEARRRKSALRRKRTA